jgi:hypothetical protein
VAPYVRTVKTASGASAVQIVYSSRREARDIEHIGSAHDDAELEVLKAAAQYRLTVGQAELDLGLDFAAAMPAGGRRGPLPITSSRIGHLVDVLIHAYRVLGFEQAVSGDVVSGQLVLALPRFAKESWRQHLAMACAAHALRRSCRLVPDQYGVSSPTTAFQMRVGPFMASHPLVNRRQNVAIGLTGLPDVPAKRTGATARWKSHWPSSAAVVAHTSRSQLSSSHRPIATRLTA